MQEPLQTPPPIPSPFETFTPGLNLQSQELRNWGDAPKVVKGWAYPLTWLALILLPFCIVLVFLPSEDKKASIFAGLFYGALWCVTLYLNRSLKKGARAAWTVQLALSCIGIIGFPVGTIIHGYLLSQWFKPETKAWFGVQ